MADDKLREKLADYIEDAHAMEQNDLRMIDSMISTTDDPQMKQMLQTHKRETEEHERRLRQRLDAMGRGTSVRKQAQAVGAALLKGVGDVARGDKAGKNARDGYTAEHLEIAAYQLLERLAQKAGDTETAEVARRNRADEEEMARKIDQSWDRVLELTLEENGILTGPVSGVTDTVGDTVGGVTDTVGGATDSARGVTDDLLGGGGGKQR
jgi:ferritin-like metal-binding protein YciE